MENIYSMKHLKLPSTKLQKHNINNNLFASNYRTIEAIILNYRHYSLGFSFAQLN